MCDLVIEAYAGRGFWGVGLARLHAYKPKSCPRWLEWSVAVKAASLCLTKDRPKNHKLTRGVLMKDKAPSVLEVIGVAFLAMAVPIFVIIGAIGYTLFGSN